jgi:murein L,D-transpeptidase YcbB/YkuD
MRSPEKSMALFTVVMLFLFLVSCHHSAKPAKEKIVSSPEQMDGMVSKEIGTSLDVMLKNKGKLDDSIILRQGDAVNAFYGEGANRPIWSRMEKWSPLADTLFHFIETAETEGLFPGDYHYNDLRSLKEKLYADSLKKKDAVLWSRADLMLTDAFMQIAHDLRKGRFQPDSITLNKDSLGPENFFIPQLRALLEKKQFSRQMVSLQPTVPGYWELKKGIPSFLDSMDNRSYTYLKYPYKKNDAADSLAFVGSLLKRLGEGGFIDSAETRMDTVALRAAIARVQRQKGLKEDGRISAALVRVLNASDAERFKRIAINLDRYKQFPPNMPERYILVNLPGFSLRLIDHDTLVFLSKIICGKPDTRTPLLNSAISDMVTYPTWTVPTSIIAKSYLPKLKNNPNYLGKIGLKLVNGKGEDVDPTEIQWSRYTRGIPYTVMQASGDNNALGVIKFNFNNPYAVYLHDTNQRYLFKNSSRAFSHGCVRVQEWQKLAFYIARNDSLNKRPGDSLRYNADSIRNWIARKERHRIEVRNPVPLFIRYFSCEGSEGRILFHDDIYGEDKLLRNRYFANKN